MKMLRLDLLCTHMRSQLAQRFPTYPLVTDIQQKASLFDELATKFEVPPLASAA